MQFLKNIKNSIYSPSYYQELLAKPFSYSIKYYFLLVLVLSVIAAIIFSVFAFPNIKLFIDNVDNKVLAYYPTNLTVTIKNGKASTNVQEPYVIKMPQELKGNENTKVGGAPAKDFKNLLVIDTKDPFSVDQFKSYQTAALLTKDSFVSYDKNGNISIMPLDKISDFTINKANVEFWVNKIKPFLVLAYPLFFLGIGIGIFLLLMLKLVYLFFGALVIWIILLEKKMHVGYWKSYQLGIHLMTLGIFIESILYLFRVYIGPLATFPFFFTVILIIMTIINVKKTEPLPAT